MGRLSTLSDWRTWCPVIFKILKGPKPVAATLTQPRSQPIARSTAPTCIVTEETQTDEDDELTEIDIEAFQENANLLTRKTEPHKPERVRELLRLVTIGEDLSTEEQQEVQQLISPFADIFALSVSKVKVADNAVHHLKIPPDATFSMKVHQKPLTPLQRRYLYASIDTMLEAGIIKACKPEEVKCISATTLAQKAHQGRTVHSPTYSGGIRRKMVDSGGFWRTLVDSKIQKNSENDGVT
jgi:hypothetical protein